MPVIHNRGRKIGDKTVARKIIFPEGFDKDGHTIKEGRSVKVKTLMPGAHMDVTDEQLAHLKANFGDEVINVEDIREMQAQFKEAPAEKPREGYVAPHEVDALVAARVAEELAKQNAGGAQDSETREQFIDRLDKMDRGDLIALIEDRELPIEHKSLKKPGELKAAVLAAYDAKLAEKEAA